MTAKIKKLLCLICIFLLVLQGRRFQYLKEKIQKLEKFIQEFKKNEV